MKTKLLRLLVVMTISITAIFALGMTTSAETTAYNIADGNINITAEGDYSISGSGTNAKITIDCSGVVNIKFENLSLKCTSYQGTMMEIKNGIVNIELDDENILQAHQDSGIYPCVSMSENAELHFYDSDSNGSIKIHGTSNYYGGGAAISGGSLYVHSGSINLVGGNKIQNNYGKSFDGKVLNIEGGSLSFAGGLISSVGNGYISVSESLVIGEGASFTVSSGSTVEIMSTASATINGTLANNGSVINSGTIESKGTITGNTVGGIVNTYDFVITGGTEGEDYTYTGGVLAIIKNGATLTVANKNPSKSTTNRIEVATGVSADITLAGVNIDVSGTGDVYSATPGLPALKIADNSTGDVTITLADSTANTLKSGPYCAGLHKSGTNGLLVISGAGILNTTGGQYGAGIGGGYEGIGSNITISGGVVTATGGWFSAGIGGGLRGSGSNITINGGTVTATGDNESAGIGGGSGSNSSEGNGSNITISGGTVTAAGGEGAAGIGGGIEGDAENIIITGGSVKAVAGVEHEYDGTTYSPAAIGQGVQFDVGMWAYSNGAEVTPTDGNGNNVYLLELTVDGTSAVTINGNTNYPKKHIDENTLYVYLPAKTVQSPNEVTVGNETKKYTYDTTNSRWITIVDAPEADNTEFTYDGEEHTCTLAESDCYTIISNKQTAAGTYTVIVNLKENCVWSDGTTADKTYTFTIAKADPVITVTTDKPSDIAGKSIAVTTTAKHPTNEALTNIPAVALTYKVGANGAETYFEGSFTIPEGTPNGTEIIITAKTSENENYNAATATTRIIVTDCEHTDKTTTWTSDDTSHWHVCNYCDAEVDKAEHGGGTANCVNKAVCSVCNTSYGEKDSTNHVSKSTEWTTDITGHWHNCACGKLDYAEHVSSGAATATTPETCTICGYEIAPATGDNTGDDSDSDDGGVVTPITPPSSVKPGWGAAENVNANITTTTETSKAPVEDEEIEDDVDDDEIGVDIADEEIEDDVDDDTDTTKPADDDEDDVYDDDLVGGDDCRHDEDEEEEERVEENDDEASDNEAADDEESNVGNGIVSGDGDPNPETGVMVCFGGAIVSAIAVIISRKRKNK